MRGTRPLVLLAGVTGILAAQPANERPAPGGEITAGYAGFADDAVINHAVIGGAVRFYLSPRISVGPEVQYMIGPGSDRDLILTGHVDFDVLTPRRRVTPFLVAGAGLFNHRERFGSASYSSTEAAFTAGGGLRAWLSDRVYAASECRIGWELHYRVTGTVGVALK